MACDTDGVKTTMVLVDDDEGFRGRARMLFEAGGFEVVGEAGDASTARALLDRSRPQVVLIDVGLPDVDGLELASELRADGAAPTVVVISGRDADDFGSRVARSGAAGFISKIDLTPGAVRDLLAGHGPW
jgi:DNA-binding NarL/FixJ family response regulator